MYKFPVYEKSIEEKIKNVFVDIIIDKPIDSTEELYNYLINVKLIEKTDVINSIDNIINSINNNKMYTDLFNNSEIHSCNTSTKFKIIKAFNKIPDSFKYNYEKLKNDAIKELQNSFKKSCFWIYDNKLEIIEFLKLQIDNIINLNKERKREANLKYYQAKKEAQHIPSKTKMSNEEKKERKREANLKYYQANKETQHIPSKTKMSEEERQEHKRLANLKYYQKTKTAVALYQAKESDADVNPNPNLN
jgi:hypothetical protein